jgi:hypothetical protein
MLSSMIETLVGLGRKSDALEVRELDRHRKTYIRQGDELLDVLDWPARNRGSNIESLEDLEVVLNKLGKIPELYVCEERIEAFLDGESALDWFILKLEKGERFEALGSGFRGSPKVLARTLRRMLGGEEGIDRFIESIRKVDFTRTSSGKSHVEHGRESLGRSVEAEVRQAQDIPTEFNVTVPVFSNIGFTVASRVTVTLLVELDLDEGEIAIFPAAEEIPSAKRRALSAVANLLRAKFDDALVVQGQSNALSR